jgi:hypothetical protein
MTRCSLVMILIGLTACVGTQKPPVVQTGEFQLLITDELIRDLAPRLEDVQSERDAKLKLWGYHRCINKGDCPEGS